MPTYREQISSIVDEGIRQGRIPAAARDTYINNLSADEKSAEFFATSLIHNSDYTRKTQALAEERRAAEAERQAAQAKLADERRGLEQWQKQAMAEVERLRAYEAQYPELTAKIAAYEQAIETYGLKDNVKVPAFQAPAPRAPLTPPTHPSPTSPTNPNYLTRDEGVSYLREVMQMNSKGLQIMGRHQAIFGAPLQDDIISEALAQGLGPDQLEGYWQTKYNVPAKQAELDMARASREREALEAEIRAKVMAELTSDPSRILPNSGAMGADLRPSPIQQYMRSGFQPPGGDSAAVDPARPQNPENVKPVQSTYDTISEAASMFRQNYTPDGHPRNGGGPAQAP